MFQSLVEQVGDVLRQLGFWGWLLFGLLYALAVTFYVPGSLLTILGGVLFGLRAGVVVVLAGAFLGIAGNWFLTRWWLRPWAQRRLEKNPPLQRLEQVLSRDEGWKLVALLRLSPLFPFVLVNLVCALTSNLRLPAYMASSAAMIPGTFLYISIGATARDAFNAEVEQPLWLQVAGVAATFAVVWLVGRTASRVLRQQLDQEQPSGNSPSGN